MQDSLMIPIAVGLLAFAIAMAFLVFNQSFNNKLLDFSAQSKLRLIALSSILSLSSIIIAESFFMNQLNKHIKSIADRDLPIIEKLTKAEFNVLESGVFFEKSINMKLLEEENLSQSYFKTAQEQNKKASQYLKETMKLLRIFMLNAEFEKEKTTFNHLLNGLNENFKDLDANFQKRSDFYRTMPTMPKKDLVFTLDAIDKDALAIERALEDLLIDFEKFTEESAHHAENLESFALKITLVLGLCLVVGLWILIFLISRSITTPISSEVKRIKEVAKPATQISQACARLSDGLSDSAKVQIQSVTDTASSCQEISQSLEVNLEKTNHSKEVSEQSTHSLNRVVQLVEELIKSISDLKISGEKLAEVINLVEAIKEKTQLIDEIVFQTKLLSFNAAVEAERAGENGKGFAIVASEIGNLANNSGKASVEISEIIKHSIVEVRSSVDENSSHLEKAGSKLDDVARDMSQLKIDIEKLAKSNATIAISSKEQAVGVKRVNEALDKITKISESISKSSQELESISSRMVANATNLNASSKVLAVIAHGKS